MQQKPFDDLVFDFCGFRSGAHLLLYAVFAFLQRRQIGQHKLGVDNFDVFNRSDRSTDMMNVTILEAANHLHNRIDFANVTKKLVAETFARTRPFNEPSDINELDRGRYNFLRMRDLSKSRQTRIWHGDDADVRIDRTKGIILGWRFMCARTGVKKRRLADVRQIAIVAMKLETRTRATMFWGFTFFSAIWLTIGTLAVNIKQRTRTAERLPATPKIYALQLNQSALSYAKELIKEGQL